MTFELLVGGGTWSSGLMYSISELSLGLMKILPNAKCEVNPFVSYRVLQPDIFHTKECGVCGLSFEKIEHVYYLKWTHWRLGTVFMEIRLYFFDGLSVKCELQTISACLKPTSLDIFGLEPGQNDIYMLDNDPKYTDNGIKILDWPAHVLKINNFILKIRPRP